jgi:DNA-binding transcriptional MerR regulator
MSLLFLSMSEAPQSWRGLFFTQWVLSAGFPQRIDRKPILCRAKLGMRPATTGARVAATEANRKAGNGRKGKAASPAPEIPDKLYFRIGEVATLLDLPTYVLRFWESEFPQLKPNKGGTGQRLYRRRDVETALQIRRLLYDEGYTIPGARQFLKAEPARKEAQPAPSQAEAAEVEARVVRPAAKPAAAAPSLKRLQAELQEISTLLGRPAPGTPMRRVPNPAHRGLHMAHKRRAASDVPPPLFANELPTPEG